MNQTQIEQAMKKKNYNRFVLARSSPLLYPNLVRKLGCYREGQHSKDIL